jgi:hypothetical protein
MRVSTTAPGKHNPMEPYKPPSSNLLRGQKPVRPKSIKTGVYLVSATLLLGFIRLPIDPALQQLMAEDKSLGYLAFLGAVSVIFLLLYAVWRGKNWARIVYSLLVIFGLYPSLQEIASYIQDHTFFSLISTLQTAGQAAAMVLFFLPSSNRWIKALKNA